MATAGARARAVLLTHRRFVIVLGVAALVRIVVVIAFTPGFVYSDGPTYLALADTLTPLAERVSGYGLLLHALASIDRGVWLVVAVQHLMGLATATLIHATLRRWAVSDTVALLACLPVLFDAMQLVVEHSVLSDVLFDLLVVAAVCVLAWHRHPGLTQVAAAGALLGCAVCVRVIGEPMVVVAVLFCLVAVTGARRKVVLSLALAAAFALPLVGYAAWYHQAHGVYALSESSGRALYMRTTTFVQCDRVSVPDYERTLCPEDPIGARRDPTYYGWHDPDPDHGLTPPAGITPDQAMHDFAIAAIRAQPGDYARVVVRDFVYNFDPVRSDHYEYDTADKWGFARYLHLGVTSYTRPAYVSHGGALPAVHQPFAWVAVAYNAVVYAWGPLLLAMIAIALAGLVVPRPPTAVRNRALILLTAGMGVGLMLAPDLTAEFVWRYQLPAVVLLPMAAALGWTRLRWHEPLVPPVAARELVGGPSA